MNIIKELRHGNILPQEDSDVFPYSIIVGFYADVFPKRKFNVSKKKYDACKISRFVL